MDTFTAMQSTVAEIVRPGHGILAADESIPTITKRFNALGIDSTEENRRRYRELLIGAPAVGDYISGVILFEETLRQKADDGTPLPELAKRNGVVPGIKVDKGPVEMPNACGDKVTQGLDGLADRLHEYAALGARFAKWRNVYAIGPDTPTPLGIKVNAETLARYAALCQNAGIVPIVEPEVLIDGDHTIEQCAEVSEQAFHALFHALHRHRVQLEFTILKPNMVLPGKQYSRKASPEEVAARTVAILKRTVPPALPTINFLSGGQTPEEATANLNAMNRLDTVRPWNLSFSYARALQEPAMAAWRGMPENVHAARDAFLKRARLNAAAQQGQYEPIMEKES